MIPRIIEWSLRNRFLVACGVVLLIALGIFEVRRADAGPINVNGGRETLRAQFIEDVPGAARRGFHVQAHGPALTVGPGDGHG